MFNKNLLHWIQYKNWRFYFQVHEVRGKLSLDKSVPFVILKRKTMENITEYKVAVHLWISVPPVLIIVGTIANCLSIAVLTRKAMRKSNTSFYLAVLAFGDIIVLYSGPLRYWMNYAFEVDVRLLSDFSCKLHGFIVYFSLDFTSWVLVAVTVDRCISACRPFTARTLCTPKLAHLTILFICILVFLANSHLFWTLGLRFSDGKLHCKGIYRFNLSIWPWIDFSLFCFVPFSLMIYCNILIIRQLLKSVRKIRTHPISVAPYSTEQRTDNLSNLPKMKVGKIPSVTVMLLSVNCLFLVMTLPIVVFQIGYTYWYPSTTLRQRAGIEMIWAVSNILQYLNNTIHFFLYCLTGPRFRRECSAMLRCKRSTFTTPSS